MLCQLVDVYMQGKFVQKQTGGYGEEIGRHFGTLEISHVSHRQDFLHMCSCAPRDLERDFDV